MCIRDRHHSGLAVDLSIYKSDGTMHNYTDEGDYGWIIDNACLYGFVRRYPDDKVAVTGVSYEPVSYTHLEARAPDRRGRGRQRRDQSRSRHSPPRARGGG